MWEDLQRPRSFLHRSISLLLRDSFAVFHHRLSLHHFAGPGHLERAGAVDVSGYCDGSLLYSFRDYERVVTWCVRPTGSTSCSGGRRLRRARLHLWRNLASAKISNDGGSASSRMTCQSSTTTADCGYGAAVGQFTGKERDAETGLDYFGARYMSSVQGRFTSPDDFVGGPLGSCRRVPDRNWIPQGL